MTAPLSIEQALRSVPDLPRWVEARALLLSGKCAVFGVEGAFVIRNQAPGGRLAVVVGGPSAEVLGKALSDLPDRELLCAPQDAALVAELLPDWSREKAELYQLADPGALAPLDPCVRSLEQEDSLDHLPRELRQELEGARGERRVWSAFADGLAASFAYAYWRTEGQFDISIDTAPDFRRRGLARLAVSELIRRERARGLRAVWGAMESNVASQRLAESLGFARVDEVVLFSRS